MGEMVLWIDKGSRHVRQTRLQGEEYIGQVKTNFSIITCGFEIVYVFSVYAVVMDPR